MTAQRWWVRYLALWQARIDSATQEINMGLRAISATGIASGALKYYGLERFVIPLLLFLAVVFGYYAKKVFDEGFKNQVSKDRAENTANFAAPNSRIITEMNGRVFVAGMKGEQLTDSERRAIEQEADSAYEKFRTGIDVGEYDE